MTQPAKEQSKFADSADKPQLADRGASITAAVVATALNASFSDTEVEAAMDLLGVAINSLISRMEAHGLIADN